MPENCESPEFYKYGFFTALGAFALTVGFVIKSAISKKKSAHELNVESTVTFSPDGTRVERKKVHASIGREEETQEKGASAQLSILGSKDGSAAGIANNITSSSPPPSFGGGLGLGGGIRVDPKSSPTGMAHRLIVRGTGHALAYIALDATESAQHAAISQLASLITPTATPMHSLKRVVDDPRFQQLVQAKKNATAIVDLAHKPETREAGLAIAVSKEALVSEVMTVAREPAELRREHEGKEEPIGRPKTEVSELLVRRGMDKIIISTEEANLTESKASISNTTNPSSVISGAGTGTFEEVVVVEEVVAVEEAEEVIISLASLIAEGTSVDEAVNVVATNPAFIRLSSRNFVVSPESLTSNPWRLTSDSLTQGGDTNVTKGNDDVVITLSPPLVASGAAMHDYTDDEVVIHGDNLMGRSAAVSEHG